MTNLSESENQPVVGEVAQLIKNLKNISKYLGLFVILTGLIIIAGWILNISLFNIISHSTIAMKANTSLCFLLSGIAFLILLYSEPAKPSWKIGQILVLIVFAIGLLTMLEYLFNKNFGIDHILIKDNEEIARTYLNGRMSANAAFGFLLISICLLSFRSSVGRYLMPSQFISILVIMLSLMGITSHFYSHWSLMQMFQSTSMSILTAFLFFILGLAILLSHPNEGILKGATSENSSGMVLRYLLPVLIVIPVSIELLAKLGVEAGLYNIDLEPIVRTLGMFFSIGVLLWFAITRYEQFELREKQAQDKVKNLNERLEKQVTDQSQKIQNANKEFDSFSYLVSHDLRAPVRAIDGFAKKLSEGYGDILDEEGKRLLNVVLQNTKNMGLLIDDLLSFSRFSRKKIESRSVDIEALVNDVSGELKEISINGGFDIAVTPPLPPANGDRTLLRQVFVNLLSNSIKFKKNGEEVKIEVGAFTNENQNVYFVKDNGVGFNMKYVDKAFEVFQRLHSAKDFEGTGVGLAIVRKIIQMHGGKIWAESEINKGATFYFSLPI